MVDSADRAGCRGVVGADGLASRSASGSAGARRSESASPHAEATGTKTAGQRWVRRDRVEGRLRSDPHPSTHRGRAGRGGRRAGEPDAALWFRLVDRDRRLLALLAEHKVLTTNQIAAIEFLSVRRTQDRLRHLRELGVVFAFRESYLRGGTSQTRYALGYLGARLIAAHRAERPPAPKAYTESLERLALWPKLVSRSRRRSRRMSRVDSGRVQSTGDRWLRRVLRQSGSRSGTMVRAVQTRPVLESRVAARPSPPPRTLLCGGFRGAGDQRAGGSC